MILDRFRQKARIGRIFISYRREDTRWVAGRLADSFSTYFGDNRVFRDIDGIDGGEDFAEVIDSALESADAVVVLIGSDWLSAGAENGQRRLDDPHDWVVQEIAAALEKQVSVYPVLVEDTPMPRSEELPESLKDLARHNAISISNSRWKTDVTRLAKVVAMDIPSARERALRWVNYLIASGLFLAIAYTITVVFLNAIGRDGANDQLLLSEILTELFSKTEKGECIHPPAWELLKLWQAGLTFLAIIPACGLLFYFARDIEKVKRRFFYAAARVGAIGMFIAYLLFRPVCEEYEPLVLFFLSTIIATLMFVLMCWSGFRPK